MAGETHSSVSRVGALLRQLAQVLQSRQYSHLMSAADGSCSAAQFIANVDDEEVRGVEVLVVGTSGKITEIDVYVVPTATVLTLKQAFCRD